MKYKLLCPRGTQTCALAVAIIKVNGNGKVILDTHPESDQHQNWTSSRGSPPAPTHQIWWWSMNPFLRYLADKNSAHRHTDTQTDTRRWPQDLAAYGRAGKKAKAVASVPIQYKKKKQETQLSLTNRATRLEILTFEFRKNTVTFENRG